MTKNKDSENAVDEKSIIKQINDSDTEVAKLIMTHKKNVDNIDIQQKNDLLQDQASVCAQRCKFSDNGCHIHCCNNLVKYTLLLIWQALCIILGVLAIYMVWNGSFLNLLEYWGLPAPEGKELTFTLFGYAFFAGWVGSATYAVCAAYNHIVSPRGNAFTSQDDQSEEKDLGQVASSTGVYSKEEEKLNNRLRKEQRRFCGENIPYWIFRPLLGGIGGVFGCLLIGFINSSLNALTTTTTISTADGDCSKTVLNAKGYIGIAFVSGMFVGDFVKAVGKLSKKFFGLEAKEDDATKPTTNKPTTSINMENVDMDIRNVELQKSDSKKDESKT